METILGLCWYDISSISYIQRITYPSSRL